MDRTKSLKQLESRISELESRIEHLENQLTDYEAASDYNTFLKSFSQYQRPVVKTLEPESLYTGAELADRFEAYAGLSEEKAKEHAKKLTKRDCMQSAVGEHAFTQMRWRFTPRKSPNYNPEPQQ